jgi:hypothetical protein
MDIDRPDKIPVLRRKLANWFASEDAAGYYLWAFAMGKQHILPALDPFDVGVAARHLAADERARLSNASLYVIDTDLCTLVADTVDKMPAFVPQPADLPSAYGFAVFAKPLDAIAIDVDQVEANVNAHLPGFGSFSPEARAEIGEAIPIVAASWGPFSPDGYVRDLEVVPGHHLQAPIRSAGWPAGGTFITFYSDPSRRHGLTDTLQPATPFAMPRLWPDIESAFAWWPGDPHPKDDYRLEHGAQGSTLIWMRHLLAAFQIALQPKVTVTEKVPTAPVERRRATRSGLKPRDVEVIRLRPRPSHPSEARESYESSGRKVGVRFGVRSFWRNQWVPTLNDHRPRLIAGHWRGPEGAPVKGAERVFLAAPPRPPRDHV